MNYPELRDYQVEGILDALAELSGPVKPSPRPRVLIVMGNPDRQGGGKSRMIQSMLETQGVDVVVVTQEDLKGVPDMHRTNWETIIVDECREMTQAMIDSFRYPKDVCGHIVLERKVGRVTTGKGKRSRLNREQRWR